MLITTKKAPVIQRSNNLFRSIRKRERIMKSTEPLERLDQLYEADKESDVFEKLRCKVKEENRQRATKQVEKSRSNFLTVPVIQKQKLDTPKANSCKNVNSKAELNGFDVSKLDNLTVETQKERT